MNQHGDPHSPPETRNDCLLQTTAKLRISRGRSRCVAKPMDRRTSASAACHNASFSGRGRDASNEAPPCMRRALSLGFCRWLFRDVRSSIKADSSAEPTLRGADAAATAGRMSASSLGAHTCLQNMEACHASYTANPRSLAPSFVGVAKRFMR
jgi:hypothetical protein